jgi:hypothetical protein
MIECSPRRNAPPVAEAFRGLRSRKRSTFDRRLRTGNCAMMATAPNEPSISVIFGQRSTLFATSATLAARLRARSPVGVALVEGAARGLLPPFKDGLPDYVRLQNVATAKNWRRSPCEAARDPRRIHSRRVPRPLLSASHWWWLNFCDLRGALLCGDVVGCCHFWREKRFIFKARMILGQSDLSY